MDVHSSGALYENLKQRRESIDLKNILSVQMICLRSNPLKSSKK